MLLVMIMVEPFIALTDPEHFPGLDLDLSERRNRRLDVFLILLPAADGFR